MDYRTYQEQINFICSNNSLNKFYVYEIWDPIKDEPFYVGKGCYQKNYYRCLDHIKEAAGIKKPKGKNRHKYNRIQKILNQNQTPIIKIIFETPDEQIAFDKEKTLIKFYGRRNLKTGSLTNLTDGGEGIAGKVYSPEELKKIALKMRGSGNPMFGKKHTPAAIQAMSKARRSRKPYKHTEEWKTHLRTHCHLAQRARPVYQINSEGLVINEYPSAIKASQLTGVTRGTIPTCCKNKHWTSKGFYWRYKGDPDIINGSLTTIQELKKT